MYSCCSVVPILAGKIIMEIGFSSLIFLSIFKSGVIGFLKIWNENEVNNKTKCEGYLN